jgi:hypothetical protein
MPRPGERPPDAFERPAADREREQEGDADYEDETRGHRSITPYSFARGERFSGQDAEGAARLP